MANTRRRTVVHLSDLHFGREDRVVVDAVREAVRSLEPDVIAISGDLTQRARRSQFKRARAFLDTLPPRQVVVPGNHDVPLFNVLARFLDPLGGYTRAITKDLQPLVCDDQLWVFGVDTTRPHRWKSGGVDRDELGRLEESVRRAPPHVARILVAHHPFGADTRDGRPIEALQALIASGIDVVLTGHLHVSYAGHTAHRYQMAGRSAVVVEAGTATSTRLRTEPNAFNVLRIEPDEIDVEVQTWNGHAFSVESIQRFSRLEGTWGARAAETDTTLS